MSTSDIIPRLWDLEQLQRDNPKDKRIQILLPIWFSNVTVLSAFFIILFPIIIFTQKFYCHSTRVYQSSHHYHTFSVPLSPSHVFAYQRLAPLTATMQRWCRNLTEQSELDSRVTDRHLCPRGKKEMPPNTNSVMTLFTGGKYRNKESIKTIPLVTCVVDIAIKIIYL